MMQMHQIRIFLLPSVMLGHNVAIEINNVVGVKDLRDFATGTARKATVMEAETAT